MEGGSCYLGADELVVRKKEMNSEYDVCLTPLGAHTHVIQAGQDWKEIPTCT